MNSISLHLPVSPFTWPFCSTGSIHDHPLVSSFHCRFLGSPQRFWLRGFDTGPGSLHIMKHTLPTWFSSRCLLRNTAVWLLYLAWYWSHSPGQLSSISLEKEPCTGVKKYPALWHLQRSTAEVTEHSMVSVGQHCPGMKGLQVWHQGVWPFSAVVWHWQSCF